MLKTTLKLSEFFSIGLQLAYESAKIIEEIHSNKLMSKEFKIGDDPVTQADLKSQHLIMKDLKLVGEEEKDPNEYWNYDVSKMKKNLISEKIFEKDATVWIDPLDGTRYYVNGVLSEVTVLIGLSNEKKARLGVVCKPYQKVGDKYEYSPIFYFGDTKADKVYSLTQSEMDKALLDENFIPNAVERKSVKSDKFRVSIDSYTINEEEEKKILSVFEPVLPLELIRHGGAGRIALDVITGETDATIHLKLASLMNRWDSCAVNALLIAFGGIYTNINGDEYSYEKGAPVGNLKGIVGTMNKETHQTFVKVLSQLGML